MFVLGIDPGLSITGYGVIERTGSTLRAVAAGVIRTDREATLTSRLAELYRDLSDVVAEFPPDAAAIEQVFVNKNLQTATAVNRASGVALLVLGQAGLDVGEYTPSQVKAALAGYGNATKDQMQMLVRARLGLDVAPSPVDAADALAVAMCHLQLASTAAKIASGR